VSLQTELDVPATGTSSKELVVALAKLQTDKGLRTANGVLSKSTRAWLVGLFPKLAEIPQEPRVAGLRQGNVAAKAEAPEDEAIRRLHLGSGYQGFVAGFKSMSFLGQGVVGHPEFLGRLANAQNYLASKFPGKSDGEIGVELGVIRTSHFRTSTKTKDNMYHGLGFALDINPVQNNWNFGNRGRGVKLSDVMKHVGDLFGEGMIRGAGDMSKNAKNGTTEELSRPTGRGSTCSRSLGAVRVARARAAPRSTLIPGTMPDSTRAATKLVPSFVRWRIVSSYRMAPPMDSPNRGVVMISSRYSRRLSGVFGMPQRANRLLQVPLLSSMASRPLSSANSAFAVSTMLSIPALLLSAMRVTPVDASLRLRRRERLVARDHIEELFVDGVLAQPVKCCTVALEQLVDVLVGAFHRCEAAGVLAGE